MDSVPIVAITGQVPTPSSATTPSRKPTSLASRCRSPSTTLGEGRRDLPRDVHEAFHIASTGRPGPVLVDLPKDVLLAETEWSWPDRSTCPATGRRTKGNQRQVGEAAQLIQAAERPVLYVGGGVIKAERQRRSCRSSPTTASCRS